MTIGQTQTILICAPSPVAQAPCPSGMGIIAMQAYVLDVSQGPSIEAQNAEFDYSYAAGIWTMAFTFVVALYLVSKSAGTVVAAIRNL